MLFASPRHRVHMTRWTIVIALLLLVPAATAQINGPREYEADFGFADPADANTTTILSGQVEVHMAGSTGPFGFFETSGFRIEGLERVCRASLALECWTGDLTLIVEDGGSAGIQFLSSPNGTYTADHALGLFVDGEGNDLNALQLNQSLLAPAVDGRMVFGAIAPSSSTSLDTVPYPAIAATSEATVFVLAEAGVPIGSWSGMDERFILRGPMMIPAFDTDFVVLPFKEGSTALFTPAETEAAREGLDFERIQTVFQKLQDASADPAQPDGEVAQNPLEDALAEVLDAALIRFPSNGNTTADDFSLVIFDSMEVRNTGNALAWNGEAAFQLEGQQVAGAQSLYGVWFFQLPWWGWGLWVVAVGLMVARFVVKPEKKHERWDQYRWIGWVAGVAMFLLIFFLWDLEMRAVWGTSLLTTDTSGTAFWVTALLQVGTMALVMGAVSWPVSIIVKNGLLLGKQGNFMGLGKPLSLLLAYLLGATLLLAYIELVLTSVIENLPT